MVKDIKKMYWKNKQLTKKYHEIFHNKIIPYIKFPNLKR